MKRTLFIVSVLVLFATAASASTLQVVSNKTTYNFGEAITLTISGADAGTSAYSAYGRLDITTGSALVNVTGAYPFAGGVSPQSNLGGWTKAQLDTGITGATKWVEAFSQAPGGTVGKTSTLLDNVNNTPFATVTLIAQNIAGLVTLNWNTPGIGTGDPLRFFGVQDQPGNFTGTSFTIVPEPTTVALLGIGLLGLALGGRRRS